MASQQITAFPGKQSRQTSIANEPQPKQLQIDDEPNNDSISSTSGDGDIALATIIDGGGECSTPSRTSEGRTDKHISGYHSLWEKTFPWVYFANDDHGTYCSLCRRFNTRSDCNRSVVFNETCCEVVTVTKIRN